jgi:hypothetical protein
MTTSSQAGKRRGKQRGAKGSSVAMRGAKRSATRGALGINRKVARTMDVDDKKILMRQSAVAPKAEPSTRGAKHWTGGRRQARKIH